MRIASAPGRQCRAASSGIESNPLYPSSNHSFGYF